MPLVLVGECMVPEFEVELRVRAWVAGRDRVSMSALLASLGASPGQTNPVRAVSVVLRRLGFSPARRRVAGERARWWERPSSSAR